MALVFILSSTGEPRGSRAGPAHHPHLLSLLVCCIPAGSLVYETASGRSRSPYSPNR
jgi:hypothetical protein